MDRDAVGTEVGLSLNPGDIVLHEDPAPHEKGHGNPHTHKHTFAVCDRRQACVRTNRGQCLLWPITARWIRIPLGTKIGLDSALPPFRGRTNKLIGGVNKLIPQERFDRSPRNLAR